MRTSHKAKDAAAEKQSYVCDTFTGHGKAHQPPLPGSPVCVFPVMLLGKAQSAGSTPRSRVLCGGTVESAKIALQSGLTEPTGKVGKSLIDHTIHLVQDEHVRNGYMV